MKEKRERKPLNVSSPRLKSFQNNLKLIIMTAAEKRAAEKAAQEASKTARVSTGLKFADYSTPDAVVWELADNTYDIKLLALYKSNRTGNILLSTSLGLATIKNIVANATAEAVKLIKDGDEFVFNPNDEFSITIKGKRVMEFTVAKAK